MAIDPHGARPHAVAMYEGETLVACYDMDLSQLWRYIRHYRHPERVFIEDQYFHKNVKTLKSLSSAVGEIKGICAVRDVEVGMINPAHWQKHYGFAGRKKAKGEYLARVHEMGFEQCRTEDHAVAILIGEYVRHTLAVEAP